MPCPPDHEVTLQTDDPSNVPPQGESSASSAPIVDSAVPSPETGAHGKYHELGTVPVPGDNPAGSRIVDWGELGREYFSKISSPTGGAISWPAVSSAALEMLKGAKDLRVALVATEALIRTEGLTGFVDGFDLLACMGQSFTETMFPKRESDRQTKVLQLEDFALSWLEENRASIPPSAGGDALQASAKIRAASQALAAPCGGEPVLTRLERAMVALATGLGASAPASTAPAAPSASPASGAPVATEASPEPVAATPVAVEDAAIGEASDVIQPAPPPDAAAPAAPPEPEVSKSGPPGKYHEIGSTPISSEEPTGDKITNWGRLATEYFQKLSSPLGGAINWDSVRSAAVELLEEGKDLRVALVATSASMRTANFPGLSDGLDLLGVLSKTFGEDLHPRSPGDRYKKVVAFEEEALTWFEEKKGQLNSKAIPVLEQVLTKAAYAQEELGKLCGGEPVLSRISRGLRARQEELEQEQQAAQAPKAPAPASSSGVAGSSSASPASVAPAVNVPSQVDNDKDASKALAQAQRLLRMVAAHYRESQPTGPVTYRLERVAQWMQNVVLPPNGFLERPDAEKTERLEEESSRGKASTDELDKLTRSFPLWLAGQRLLHTQLEAEDRAAEAAVVRAESAALFASLPGLETVKFKDDEPVIDEATSAWLSSAGGSGAISMPLPDVSGVVDKKEEKLRKKVRKEADKLAAKKKLPEAIAKYQSSISQCSAGRDRFLWKLELAAFCFGHNVAIANSLLNDLEAEAHRSSLGAWEPELATVVYVELLKLCPAEDTARMAELFGKLVLIDPQKAAQLQLPDANVNPERPGASGSSAAKPKRVNKENPDG